MDIDVYDVIFIVIGLFFGQIVAHIFIYKVLHPYVVVPYLKNRRKNRRILNRQVDAKQAGGQVDSK